MRRQSPANVAGQRRGSQAASRRGQVTDDRVAAKLADEMSFGEAAKALEMSEAGVRASFGRICKQLGPQAV